MNKYVIKNCPAFVLMRTASSGTYFNICGIAKGHVECKDCTDCVMKQIFEKLRELEEKSIELSYCEFKQYVDEVFLADVFYSNMLCIQEVE